MTYSVDFRKKALQVRERDALTIEEVAVRFSVGKGHIQEKKLKTA